MQVTWSGSLLSLSPLLMILVVVVGAQEKKNVLFFAADDMRPQLGIYRWVILYGPVHTEKKAETKVTKIKERTTKIKETFFFIFGLHMSLMESRG